MDLLLTPFTLGQSTVVTLPKTMGVTPQMRLKAKKIGKKITLEIIDHRTQIEKNVAQVKKLAGGIKGKFSYTPEELNRRYEIGTYGHTWK